MACGDLILNDGIAFDCTNPLQGGANATLRIMNFDDIDGFTYDVTDPNIITGITLASGGKLVHTFEGFKRSLAPTTELENTDAGQAVFRHTVPFVVFDISQKAKNTIEKLAKGSYVAIVENNTKDEHSFEVYGKGSGLELIPGSLRAVNENNGAYTLTLATGEGEFEGKLPQTLYDGTSYASTRTYVTGLETPTT